MQLQKAIKGQVVMSMELERMFNSLMDNQVPVIWANAAYLSY
jgi:dynein heavy chain, axonemal